MSATGSSEPARGIKFLGDGEWQAREQGVQGRRQWRKVYLAMDTATSDIRAVEFTPSSDGDQFLVSPEGQFVMSPESTEIASAQGQPIRSSASAR